MSMFEPASDEEQADFAEIDKLFNISVADDIRIELSKLGAGYSAKQELLVFGGASSSRPLIEWNLEMLELGVFPHPRDGGPLFVAENCLGVQFGFRSEEKRDAFIAFDPNIFESLFLTESASEFFELLCNDEELVALGGAVYPILREKGPLRPGHHLVPFVSPMFGGSLDPDNWSLETAKVHIATAQAEAAVIRGK